MDLEQARHNMAVLGCTLVPGVVSETVAAEWAERARCVPTRIERGESESRDLDEGGARHHGIADAHGTRDVLPELFGLYEACVPWLSYITGQQVITSPYPRSAITLKVYDRPGDDMGWHRDTNPLTCLLILTATEGNYGTLVEGRTGEQFHVWNDPGACWVMYGRELRHMVPSLPEGMFRVTVPLNYYFTDDTWRPEGTDELVYGATV